MRQNLNSKRDVFLVFIIILNRNIWLLWTNKKMTFRIFFLRYLFCGTNLCFIWNFDLFHVLWDLLIAFIKYIYIFFYESEAVSIGIKALAGGIAINWEIFAFPFNPHKRQIFHFSQSLRTHHFKIRFSLNCRYMTILICKHPIKMREPLPKKENNKTNGTYTSLKSTMFWFCIESDIWRCTERVLFANKCV